MSRNGAGLYSRAVSAYVFNTVISQTDVNAEMDDIAAALTASIAKDGQTVPTANLPMGGFKLTGLGAATTAGDAVRYEQLIATAISNTPAGSVAAATVQAAINELDTEKLALTGGTMTGGINSARGNITQHATTMDFFAVTSPDLLDGTGSAVTITACVNAPQAGAVRKFYPIVATVLTHGATFDCVGNANLTAAAGDCWIIEAKTASTYRVSAVKETGLPVAFIDEDSMASDSAVLVPSQQSVKAYVDAQASGRITLGTPVASTSGTSIDFTSIPAGTKRITINFSGVSTTGASLVLVQLGDAGGVEATGYLGCTSLAANRVAHSTGTNVDWVGGATVIRHGSVIFTLLNSSTNLWSAWGGVSLDEAAGGNTIITGTKALSATLDRVRITTVGGSDTFAAGSINIAYE